MDTLDAIMTRRSIRRYKDTPVDDATLEKVLEAARWAPSWANTQCARFVVVRDNDVRAGLVEALSEGNPATKALQNAPLIIVACAVKGTSGYYHGEVQTPKGDYFMLDVGLAMENLVLAAHALGLGTVHVGLFDHDKVDALLNVPEGTTVVEMTPLGYPDREATAPPRKELSEIVVQDRFA